MGYEGPTKPGRGSTFDHLDDLIEQITVDADGDGEQLWAFRQAFEDGLTVPCDAFIIGQPVTAIQFDCDRNERRGLTARCGREDGSEYLIAVAEVVLPADAPRARHLAAYSKCMGLAPNPSKLEAPTRAKTRRQTNRPTSIWAVPSEPFR